MDFGWVMVTAGSLQIPRRLLQSAQSGVARWGVVGAKQGVISGKERAGLWAEELENRERGGK